MTRSRFVACCVWLLGVAVAITGLYCGLDHWGRFFPKHLGLRAQMPLDVTLEVSNSTSLTDRGATCICSRCRCIRPDGRDDDCTGDEPDEPVGDRLVMWLCDDDGGQKQFGLAASSGDAVWSALIVDPAARLPSDESSPPALSLNSLHVRLQI